MKEGKWIILILSLALLFRIVYLVENAVNNPTFFTPIIDSHTYYKLAVVEVVNRGMGPESTWQSLFYPYFLSICYRICSCNLILVRIFQIFLGTITCFCTFLLGKRLFSIPVGLISSLMVALSGPLIFYEGELLPTTWATFWFLLSLLYFIKLMDPTLPCSIELNKFNRKNGEIIDENRGETILSLRREKGSLSSSSNRISRILSVVKWNFARGYIHDSNLWFLGLGIVCGIGITIRPNIFLFYITGFLWLLFHYYRRLGWRRTIISGSAILLGLSLISVTVLIRNYNLTRHWILMPVSGGLNFYIGNNPEAAKTIATRPGESWRQLTVLSRKAGIFTEPYGSRYFYGKAFDYIRDDPVSFAEGLLLKTILFFNGREIPRNIDIYLYRRYSCILQVLVWRLNRLAFPMGIILPTAFLGLVIGLRRFRTLSFLYLFFVVYSFSIILFFVTSRYRLPLLPVLCIFSASGIYWFWQQCKSTPHIHLLLPLVFLLPLFIICNRNLNIPEDEINFESEMYRSLGSVYMEEGIIKDGTQYLKLAVQAEPGNADGHNLLGAAYLYTERIEDAVKEFQQAIACNPEHSGAYKNLGMIFKIRTDLKKAREHFMMALRYNAEDEELHLNLAEIHEETGNIVEAALEYYSALRIKPDQISTRRSLSIILGKLGEWNIAIKLIEEAVRHEPDNALLRCDLGFIYGNMNQSEKAIKEFREALRLQPNLPVALLNLEMIYSREKEEENANVMHQSDRRQLHISTEE